MRIQIRRVELLRLVGATAIACSAALLPASGSAGENPCDGLVIETETGSEQDDGSQGIAHNTDLAVGGSTSWAIAKRCTAGDQAICLEDDDCAAGTCAATCDCSVDGSCELAGPIDQTRCLANMAECTTNTDCPSSGACVRYFGPPQPVSYAGTPLCLLTHFEGTASGSYETSNGDVSISATLRRRLFLGIGADQPCPYCGKPSDGPEPGDQFLCQGGARNGLACTVEGVTPDFGGTSADCPPTAAFAVGGSGLVLKLDDLTTEFSLRTAKLQCAQTGFTGNPLVPGSNPKCTDNLAGPVCATNTDCRRCSGDGTTVCTSEGDCAGNGSCAEAPDQPVSCGFWCHCGFCDGNAAKPCFESSDCGNGETCQKGGATGSTSAAQQRPNDCSNDGFRCGTDANERCESSSVGSCTLQSFRTCTSNTDCQNVAAGTCVFEDKPCFESTIARSGFADPLGRQCAFQQKSCNTNADCQGEGDFCIPDTSRAGMAGIYCLSATSTSSINTTIGLAGPGVLTLNAFVKVCRCLGDEPGCETVCGTSAGCGNGTIDGGEDCDGGPCCSGECTYLASTTVCRGTNGSCDIAESCSGSSGSCPADAFAPSSTGCRTSAGVCDVAESCSGSAAACPGDTFAATTTVCRASAADCDKAEQCSGTGATCPANGSEPDGTICDDADACTSDDQCTGGSCAGTAIPQCGGVCGDGSLDDGEACDDGNATFTQGEYCGVACVLIPCGKPTNSSGVLPKTSDALFILRVSVGQLTCSPRVCSPDGNQTIVSSDALRVLRAAVEQPVSLDCPTE
jgi:hypothetical protein